MFHCLVLAVAIDATSKDAAAADAVSVLTVISVALQHLFLSSDCDSLPKFSSTSLGKNHCQKFCKKYFSGFFLRARFVDKLKKDNTKPSYFPRVHMLPELRGLFLHLLREELPFFFSSFLMLS